VGRDAVSLLAATLDVDDTPSDDDALPVPWHWACFVPRTPTRELGPDGHPARRAAMHDFPSRMWVGGAVRSTAPVRIGAPATRASALVDAELKQGSLGAFWLVQVGHTVSQDGRVCIDERQDIVLRPASATPAPGDPAPSPERAWVAEWTPDPPVLFRYSALTFNSHRIHYDAPYAIGVEGYPDLVVQGPLTATRLCDLARARTQRPVATVAFRARAPLFANRRCWLTGEPAGDGASLSAVRGDGVTAMTLDVTFAPADR
jgi:3-methylfumaryl-CoA hydratase